jgi:hypothetical protein
LEKCFEKLEKEKEREFISYSVSGPAAERFFLAQPSSRPAARPAPFFGPSSETAQLARGCADVRLSVTDAVDPHVRVAFFLLTPASDFLSLFTTDQICAPIFSLPFLELLQGYISRVLHPSASTSSS